MDYSKGKVYKIVNDIDDRIYVGSTCQTLAQRMSCHRSNVGKKPSQSLYALMGDHGVDKFRIVLVEDYPCERKDQLRAREEYWRVELNAQLNKRRCGTGIVAENKNDYCKKYRQEFIDECKERDAKYYAENAEKIKEQKKIYYKENMNELNAKNARYQETHAEEIKEQRAQHYKDNADKIKAERAEHYAENAEELKQRASKYRASKSEKVTCECGRQVVGYNLSTHRKTKLHTKLLAEKS